MEYNSAVAGMANELTLLNIVRAKEAHPLHYTSVGRLSGSIVVKAGSSFGQLKDEAITRSHNFETTGSPLSLSKVAATRQVVKGGNTVTPSLSGELTTGPSFDITILDSQKFYQGVLAAVPFGTIENFINQGFDDEVDNQLLIHLLVERIEFRAAEAGYGYKKGDVITVLRNRPSGPEAARFSATLACYELGAVTPEKDPTPLAPLSRVTRDASGVAQPISIEDLARFDGEKFELSGQINADPSKDGEVTVVRPRSKKRAAELTPLARWWYPTKAEAAAGRKPQRFAPPACYQPLRVGELDTRAPVEWPDPERPPEEPTYVGGNEMLVYDEKRNAEARLKVEMDITFRSPEGVIRYVGDYLKSAETYVSLPQKRCREPEKPCPDSPERTAAAVYIIGGTPLFTLRQGKSDDALVATELRKVRYYVADDPMGRRNLQVIALIEQLINLHKESGDRPTTVPVQLVPGSS